MKKMLRMVAVSGVLALAGSRGRHEGVGRACHAGRDSAAASIEQRKCARNDGEDVDRRIVAGGAEDGDALAVLDEQHGEGQGNNQFKLGSPRELRQREDRGGQNRSGRVERELTAGRHGQAPHHKGAEHRWQEPA